MLYSILALHSSTTEKNFKLAELFFSQANEVKTCGLVQQLILRMLRDLILQLRDSHSLNGDPALP